MGIRFNHNTGSNEWYDKHLLKLCPHVFDGAADGDHAWCRFTQSHPKVELMDSEVFRPVKDWLMDQDKFWMIDAVNSDGVETYFNLYISDPNVAMMFKLAWCGV